MRGNCLRQTSFYADLILMPSRTFITQAIIALSLAWLLVGIGHAASLLSQAAWQPGYASETPHSAAYADPSPNCTLCANHRHSPMTADHVHETPYLGHLLDLPTQAKNSGLAVMPDTTAALLPVYRFERPPRSTRVI